MHALLLKYHATSQTIPFASKDDADAALDALKPHLGDRFGRNDELTHTIVGVTGKFVVVTAKIESAAVVDLERDREVGAALRAPNDELEIAYQARMAAAIAKATAAPQQ